MPRRVTRARERGHREDGQDGQDGQAPRGPVLLIEDSRLVAKVFARRVAEALERPVVVAASFAEAEACLAEAPARFLAAVVDLELPDAAPGAAVDLALKAGVPTLVLTGSFEETVRETILAKDIVDYFLKDDKSVDGVIDALRRLEKNPTQTLLIVDDSRAFRQIARRMLATHRFTVLEASDGLSGLAQLQAHPEIQLVITDNEMPEMGGLEFVQQLRSRRSTDELAIVGVSAQGSGSMSALFLKYGADDFLTKPFEKEEFYCRIYRSLRALEHIQEVKRAAYTDLLTGLHNRLYFFQHAPQLYEEQRSGGLAIGLAMMDIDFFKKINDTHGHAAGDLALRHLSGVLTAQLPADGVLARFGGEEFCALVPGLGPTAVQNLFESVRAAVEAAPVRFGDVLIPLTISIGAAVRPGSSLDEMINRADGFLYEAKGSGRNRVVVESTGASGTSSRT